MIVWRAHGVILNALIILSLRRFRRRSIALAAAAALSLVVGSAHAASYGFSFDNVDGAVSGTVSGQIGLPDGDGTFAAISVFLTSLPAALGMTAPVNVGVDVPENVFVVSGGVIDNAASEFLGFFNVNTGNGLLALRSTVIGGTTFLDMPDIGSLGEPGVRDSTSTTLAYTSLSSDVPLPGVAPRLGLGIAALVAGGAAHRRKAA